MQSLYRSIMAKPKAKAVVTKPTTTAPTLESPPMFPATFEDPLLPLPLELLPLPAAGAPVPVAPLGALVPLAVSVSVALRVLWPVPSAVPVTDPVPPAVIRGWPVKVCATEAAEAVELMPGMPPDPMAETELASVLELKFVFASPICRFSRS